MKIKSKDAIVNNPAKKGEKIPSRRKNANNPVGPKAFQKQNIGNQKPMSQMKSIPKDAVQNKMRLFPKPFMKSKPKDSVQNKIRIDDRFTKFIPKGSLRKKMKRLPASGKNSNNPVDPKSSHNIKKRRPAPGGGINTNQQIVRNSLIFQV